VTERDFLDIISGRRRGASAAIMRAAFSVAELPYAAAVAVRNRLYDQGILANTKLPRPTISIGNVTAGGVGKTPLVAFLAGVLRAAGHKPAVLMRGYRSVNDASDEQMLLERALGGEALPVMVDPDRVRGAEKAIAKYPEVDVFLLDDGMQHRRVARDVEIVVISAVEPFGYGRVLPRGLLRESLTGLRRAQAIVITHANEVEAEKLKEIEGEVRRVGAAAPIFRADHRHVSLRASEQSMPMDVLKQTPYFLACGIGSPESLLWQLQKYGGNCVGHRFFSDHHHFTASDLDEITTQAKAAGAKGIVVTEKDWMKLEKLAGGARQAIPIWRLRLEIAFWNDDGERLVAMVSQRAFGTPC